MTEYNLREKIDEWEGNWCSDAEEMNPLMKEELDNILKEFIKLLKIEAIRVKDDYYLEIIDKLAGEKLT